MNGKEQYISLGITKKRRSQHHPIDGKNLVPKMMLPPLSKCNVNKLPTLNDLLVDFKCERTLYDHNRIKIVKGTWQDRSNCVVKTFNIHHTDRKLMKQKVNDVWREYQLVRHAGLLKYGHLYYDKKTFSLIIPQVYCSHTLFEYIRKISGPLMDKSGGESIAKNIVMQLLKKLWTIHNCHFVHRDVKPHNIMLRKKDKWLLIDFSDARPVNFKGPYCGTIGYTAPEIDYNAQDNRYQYSADIFSLGLVILFMMTGYQPLQLPASEIKKYQSNKSDNRKTNCMMRKQVHSNWYYGHIQSNGETVLQNHIRRLLVQNKISEPLFDLLIHGMLVYNPQKRWNCQQIYDSEWLKGIHTE